MTIDIKRSLRADVSYHGGKSLDIHAVFQRHRSERVTQVVEAHLLALRSFQYLLEFAVQGRRIPRLTFLDGRWEYPLTGGVFLVLRKDIQHIGRQDERAYRGFGLRL